MATTIEVNTEQVVADLEGWSRTIEPTIASETRSLAQSLRSEVESKIPVLTGLLASTTTVTNEPGGFGVGYGGVIYAGYIEFGGRHGRELVSEGRYLYPTMEAAEPEIQRAIEAAVTTSIERYSWSHP
jgi:hypothetical protein